ALLEALMKGEELWVKMSVVGNLRTPVALLRVHARHKDQNVRRVIAEHPRTPPEILASLAQDRDPSVQIAVAGNWQTPVEVLRALAYSEFEGLKHWGLKALAQNIQTPGDVLQMLAQNTQDSPIRWNATFVSRLQIELGESLDREEVGTILKDLFRTTVGTYPAIKVDSPENQFSTLVLRKDSALVRRAILTVLAMDWNVSTIGELYPSWLWKGKPDNGFHLLSPGVLQKLAISPNWKIRLLVASHEHASEQTRQRLSQDGNRYVRAIARAKAAHLGETALQADPFLEALRPI
ncbi:MAG TPA: hypothetical protein VFN35_36640, partial [Ktedonobacteraceae bacterium]|nr:hypothetical protein [Ktedonobacteraceae bacterium]